MLELRLLTSVKSSHFVFTAVVILVNLGKPISVEDTPLL